MKVSHLEKEEVEKEVIDDILCNKCGKSCRDSCLMNYEGLIEMSVQGGYASKLGDMVTWTFSICESCLEELFGTFKVPVERSNAWYEDEAEAIEAEKRDSSGSEHAPSGSDEGQKNQKDEGKP